MAASTELAPESLADNNDFYVVGIGASAGGLEALQQFFDSCPYNTNIAFVILQHLSQDYKSLMPELLARHTQMKVSEVVETEKIEPNHIYLIQGSTNILIKGDELQLTNRPPVTEINFAIDTFFYSLAKEKKERAIGVILSGTGSDGTRGGKAIKEAGGTIFVQDPNTSSFDGMPRSAISNGLADYILSPQEMPRELVQFIENPNINRFLKDENLGPEIPNINRLLRIIKNQTGYDFSMYKKPTLLRRTAKRMNICKVNSVEAYIDYIYENPAEKNTLVEEFLIGVTRFFRNPLAFNILEKEVMPRMVAQAIAEGQELKFWVVGCSTGEEAYSLAILLEEAMAKQRGKVNYKIFATDIDTRSLEIATKGSFSENIAADIHPNRLGKYFTSKDKRYQILPEIRKHIIFSKHDILNNPPFSKMDLVTCRNVLIYLEPEAQQRALSNLHYALNPGGILFLGSSETVGIKSKYFEEVSFKWNIFRNVEPSHILQFAHTPSDSWRMTVGSPLKIQSTPVSGVEERLFASFNALLLKEINAVAIWADERLEIKHVVGNLKKYLEIPEEGFSNNLQRLLPEEFHIPLASATRGLIREQKNSVSKKVQLIREGVVFTLKLVVQNANFSLRSSNSPEFLILIIEERSRELEEGEINNGLFIAAANEEVQELKSVLFETQENLQATIEELETSNEEMQATNEELIASNEELQSTNEELQSVNEELHTVNAELQSKNNEVLESYADIENLIKNINVGTIFLDSDMRIRKFTPQALEHFPLFPEDIGRPISHFTGNGFEADLAEEAKKVIRTLNPVTTEFQNRRGVWYQKHIFPYRIQDNRIKGVVINYQNIDALKRANLEANELNQFLKNVTELSETEFYIFNIREGKTEFTTNKIAEKLGYTPKEYRALAPNTLSKIIHSDDLSKVIEYYDSLSRIQ
ncbi:MAG: chemotaxis protein CheB, partial [Bacteroidota bacterium]